MASVMPSWYLNGQNYGYYSQFYVSISIGILILGAGLNTAFTYYVGQGVVERDYVKSLLNKQDTLCFLTAVILIILSVLYRKNLILTAVFLGGTVSCFQIRCINLPAIALGKRDIRQYNLLTLIRPLSVLSPVLIWSFFFEDIKILIFLTIIFSIFCYFFSKKITSNVTTWDGWPKFSGISSFREIMSYSAIAQISNLSYTLGQRAFVYILSALASPQDSGVFFILLSLIEALLIIPTSTGKYFFSYASGGELKKKEIISAIIVSLLFVIMSNILLYLLLFSLEKYQYISSDSIYFGIGSYLLMTIPLQIVMFFLRISASLACGYGFVKLPMYGSILGGGFSLILGYFLVGKKGVYGAIHALLIGNGVNLFILILGLLILNDRFRRIKKV